MQFPPSPQNIALQHPQKEPISQVYGENYCILNNEDGDHPVPCIV